MIIENDIKLDFSDVLVVPKRSTLESRNQVNLIKKFKTKNGSEFEGVPIIVANMSTGSFEMLKVAAENKMFVAIAKYNNDKWPKFFSENPIISQYGFYTIGMSDSELQLLEEFSTLYPDVKICVDIANGYTQKFASFIAKVRASFPKNVIIAGNVATPEMVQELIINGADFVKVGVGPGANCTTRKITGVGFPQISAAISCSDAAHGLGAGIVLDGGMRVPGDVVKAFCVNSDLVMIGGMFAGTDEQDGELITKYFESHELEIIPPPVNTTSLIGTASNLNNPPVYKNKVEVKKFKIFYGMSSDYAQEKHGGGMKEYRASEGAVTEVPYTGPVQNIINELFGGLRSGATYIGSKSIKDFGKCATLIRVTRQHDKF